ncbi:MAG: mechanosensitive ion channel family protein [Acidimicrobiia bacterium]|nr:mechanosensitive ion channel family protein [Acidimicrobiia bacterium]
MPQDLTDLSAVASDAGVIALRIGLILIGTFVVVRLLRRWVPRSINSFIEQRERDEANLDQVRGSEAKYLQREAQRERARQRATTLATVLVSLFTGVLWFVGFLLVLGEIDVDLAPLLAGAGVAGIAIGFGAQTLIRDLLAGFFIVLEDQYAVGDIVDLDYATGEVERINLRFTRLRDYQGKVWFIPNGEVKRVGNFSKLWSKAVLDVGIAYEDDIERAQAAMIAAANDVREADVENATIIDEPEVLGVEQLGADSVVLRMVVRTEPGEQWSVARAIRARIKARFDAEGIEIPFAQSVVRFRSEGQPPTPMEPSAGDDSGASAGDGSGEG